MDRDCSERKQQLLTEARQGPRLSHPFVDHELLVRCIISHEYSDPVLCCGCQGRISPQRCPHASSSLPHWWNEKRRKKKKTKQTNVKLQPSITKPAIHSVFKTVEGTEQSIVACIHCPFFPTQKTVSAQKCPRPTKPSLPPPLVLPLVPLLASSPPSSLPRTYVPKRVCAAHKVSHSRAFLTTSRPVFFPLTFAEPPRGAHHQDRARLLPRGSCRRARRRAQAARSHQEPTVPLQG